MSNNNMLPDSNNGFARLDVEHSNGSRIFYVDPNNIYGEIDGATITPDYTDFCMWCNLVVEKTTRIKKDVTGHDETTTYSASFDMTKEGNSWVSFLRGVDAENYNYLSTEYTDIDFNTIKKKNILEGIGIESIQISFENYYVPSVVIKFVDVRGSGFFAREEATHNTKQLVNLERDKNNNMIDNFYGCFNTFPYPRFRLQVKGYYGEPVTYQLACSSFDGAFDSATGNFNLTVKFIGFQYSIMGDIPVDFIIAAPNCTYFGKSYWDEKVSSNEWALSNGDRPMRLTDFFGNIKSAIQTALNGRLANLALTGNEENDYQRLSTELGQIQALLSSVNVLKGEIKKSFGVDNCIETDLSDDTKHEYVIAFQKPNTSAALSKDFATAKNEYVRTLKNFIDNISGSGFSDTSYMNSSITDWEPGNVALLEELITIKGGNASVINKSLYRLFRPEVSVKNVSKTTNMYEDLPKSTIEIINKKLATNPTFVKKGYTNAAIFNFNGVGFALQQKEKDLKASIKKLSDDLSSATKKDIKTIVGGGIEEGFEPYIGNFFKVVMCHLETFVAMVYNCVDNIESQIHEGKRIPGGLGITMDQTDANVEYVPPFPAVYKTQVYREGRDNTATAKYANTFKDDLFAKSWVGDFVGKYEWEEEKLINALYKAILQVEIGKGAPDTSAATATSKFSTCGYPSAPLDLMLKVPSYSSLSRDGLAAYLGFRMMTIYNVLNRGNEPSSEIIKLMARMDSYNYAVTSQYVDRITSNIVNTDDGNGDDLKNDLLRLMTDSKDSGKDDNREYEFATTTTKKRQPIFQLKDGKYEYSYMKDKNGNVLIPMASSDLGQNNMKLKYEWTNKESGAEFGIKFTTYNDNSFRSNDNTLHTSSTSAIMTGSGITDIVNKESYKNPLLFDIVSKQSDVDSISSIYGLIKDGGDEDYAGIPANKYVKLLNEYWHLNDEDVLSMKTIGSNGYISYDALKKDGDSDDGNNLYYINGGGELSTELDTLLNTEDGYKELKKMYFKITM